MTEQEVVRQFRGKRPRTVDEMLERCGLTLRFVESGAYRKVYQVANLPLVVKLPRPGGKLEEHARGHAQQEFNAYKRVLRSKTKYKELQRYMPEVLYFNWFGGVTLMRMYDEVPGDAAHRRRMNDISREVAVALGEQGDWHESDLGEDKWDNYGLDRDGTLKIIDLGLLLPVTNGNK